MVVGSSHKMIFYVHGAKKYTMYTVYDKLINQRMYVCQTSAQPVMPFDGTA